MARLLLFASLCLPGASSYCQEETTADTLSALVDTTYSDETYEEDEEPKETVPYFTPVWMPEAQLDSIQWRNLPDSLRNMWTRDEEFWYAGLAFDEERPDQNNNNSSNHFTNTQWFESLLWVISLAGFACFILMYLMNNNIVMFRRKNQALHSDEELPEMDDIFAINYAREIEKASNSGNYRLAIRLMFLRLLKNLSDRNIIQYKHDRTNLDYLLQLSSTRYYSDFFRITRNYEYSWYGQFQVNEDVFRIIKKDFETFDPAAK